MNAKTISRLLILFQFSLFPAAYSQTLTDDAASARVKGAELVVLDAQRKSISFVRLKSTSAIPVNESASWLRSAYEIPLSTELRKVKQDEDNLGYIHSKYQQYIHGFPVEWSTLNVHSLDDKIISSNAECYSDIVVPATPALSEATARRKALDYFKAPLIENTGDLDKPQLLILPVSGTYKLAYKFDLYAHEPLKRSFVYVDATSGEILLDKNRIHTGNATGTAVTRYNGTRTITTDSVNATTYRLRETGRGNGIQTWDLNNTSNYGSAVDFTDADNYWNTVANFDNAAYDAHFGSEATYDYFWNLYGRNSIDNAGYNILSYVHYNTGYVNAFWDGTRMTYGDGDGVEYFPLTCIDIVGHEITHGLTEHSAGLIYSGESGALNESFSDIFGVTIDFYKNPGTANWLEGDQCNINGIPFRSMQNPNLYDCPDTYGGLYWNNGDIVHYNSSVQNFWYYLLCNGGSGTNDIGNNYLVNGIGMTDAAAIAFRNLTVYLTPNSTFADARTYAMQSATDLFGNCSNQLIQATNAWYAVGVGGLFSNAVVAGFSVPGNFYCTVPANVAFSNNSVNSTSYRWFFGDGDSSTAANPVHAYSGAGVYTVTLIANGAAACSSSDTIIKPGHITITNGGGPITAACSPTTVSYCCNAGITRVEIGTISNATAGGSDGYRDYTCSHATTCTAGDFLPVSILTGPTNTENVKVFIDYDNNGQMNSTNELVFVSQNKLQQHGGIVYTPTTATLNTPLRMRVMSDPYTITNSCTNLQNGQAEDYTISFTPNTLPPIADFGVSDSVVSIGDTVRFYDLSLHAPTAWNWTLSGGTVTSSTLRSPYTIYNATGTYPVRLVVSNSFGTDSIVKIAYITVVNEFSMCTNTSTSALSGFLYDSGGPTGTYDDGENCGFLIQPPCADTITLSFTAFSTEGCCDFLRIYNGTNASAPLLLSISGTSLHAPVKATAGAMYIQFTTDGSVVASGFSLNWTTRQYSTTAPVADFNISDNTPPLNVAVGFTDVSTNSPNAWLWNFGDGFTSTLKNPSHAYALPGTYNVQLIAYTCTASDTISKNLTVQVAPAYSSSPDSIQVSVSCGDSIVVPVRIVNTGTGDLVVNSHLNGNQNQRLEVLALQYGTDLGTEYPNTISSINQYFTNYNLTTINTTSAATLQAALAGKDVFLMTEPETGTPSVYTGFAPVLQNFVSNGNTAILCGSYTTQSACIFNTGLFSGTYAANAYNSTLNIVNASHPLMEAVTPPLTGPDATFIYNITNADKIPVVTYNGNDAVTLRNIGSGRAVYVAFDYYAYNTNTRHIISNAVKWAQTMAAPQWVYTNPDSVLLAAGDTGYIYVTLNSTGLNAGTYRYNLVLETNDPLHLTDTIPVSMTIGGPAVITLNKTCLNFGSIMQHTTKADSVRVVNQGCDSLHVSGISSSSSDFTLLSPSVFTLAPHDSAFIKVQFNPATTGTLNATLSIFNNDNDTTICLNGSATAAPDIEINPDSFHVTLLTGDSTTRPLTIYNIGGSDLTYSIQGDGIGLVGDTSVLLIQESTAWGLNMNSFLQTTFGITPTVITSSQIAATNFMLYDVIITIGEESTTYYNNISNNRTKFEAFVNAGGILQYQMATMGATNISLAGGATVLYGNQQNQNTGLLPLHPILAGVTNPLQGNYANHCTLSNLPADAKIISVTGTGSFPTTAEYSVGRGLVIATGMTWEYLVVNGFNSGAMLPNSIGYLFSRIGTLPPWLRVTSNADTVSAGDSSLVTVRFNATGLNGGNYTSQLVVKSNDPVTPEILVPCTMTVIGTPRIAVTDTAYHFGDVMVGAVSRDTLIVRNYGSDTLHITNITTTHAAFAVNITAFDLLPGDTQKVVISFSPSAITPYAASLTVWNNDRDTTIYLDGRGVAAPSLQLIPGSITATLTTCVDSITIPLQIINNGGSDLDFHLTGASGGHDTLQVLAFTYGTDLVEEYPRTLAALNQNFTRYRLTTTSSTTPAVLQSALAGKDVLLMPESESGTPSVYTTLAPVLQSFVNNGGSIVICGSGGTQAACVFNTGLFSGTYYTNANGLTATVTNPSHPIAAGLSPSFPGSNATFVMNFTNADKTDIIQYQSQSLLSVRNIGMGRAIYIGFDYYAYDVNASRALGNIFNWLQNDIAPAWISVSPDSGTALPNDTVTAEVTLYNARYTNDTLFTTIYVHTNDPLHPLDSILVTLVIASPPCMDFIAASPDCNKQLCLSDSLTTNATSVLWDFGDGYTSASSNPCHTYAAAGMYLVELKACNGAGCDSLVRSVLVPNIASPIPASCSPATTGYCCNRGITMVQFNTISNASANGSAGYQDFTCTKSTTVTEGLIYPISITTGATYNETVKVWIDYDNNGIFSAAELVLTSYNQLLNHYGNIVIPSSAVQNVPLRMRIMSDYYGSPAPQSCTALVYGQCEDYTVVVASAIAPVAAFSYQANSCTGLTGFTDISFGSPTSWHWDFGDGNTDTVRHPVHQYASAGTYPVQLIACNAISCDTVVYNVQVTPLVPGYTWSGNLVAGQVISFSSTAQGANYWLWNFGDGDLASADSVSHTYSQAGIYLVTLFVSNASGCSGIYEDTLVVLPVGLEELNLVTGISLYPNPFTDEAVLKYKLMKETSVSINLVNVLGQHVKTIYSTGAQQPGEQVFPITVHSPGIYYIEMLIEGKRMIRKLVKTE